MYRIGTFVLLSKMTLFFNLVTKPSENVTQTGKYGPPQFIKLLFKLMRQVALFDIAKACEIRDQQLIIRLAAKNILLCKLPTKKRTV